MSEIELQLPEMRHQIAAEEFKNEFFEAQELVINGSALLDQMDYGPWLSHAIDNRKDETVRSDWVTATTFFALRKGDGRIVGMIDVRHNLNNEFLSKYGGHIGYAVRPSERNRGYATAMLKMGLKYASSLNLSRVMLGCYAANIPSAKVIEKCGGVLSETKPFTNGKPMNIYWIGLKT